MTQEKSPDRVRFDHDLMLKALRKIANPIKALQDECPPGYKFEGQIAVNIANDPNYYRGLAKKALRDTGNEE